MTKKRVVVGLSGGVDSSVSAHLLVEQGYEVIGVFMKNWHDNSVTISDDCPWQEDSNDAMLVADKLGIPFQVVDLSKEYKEKVVDYMFSEYQKGRTPNPDVLCNREIKFDVFLKVAEQFDADFVATGHYCIKEKQGDIFQLIKGKDNNKDQSYFLCQLSQHQLSKALFPIGNLEKSEVRKIAKKLDLITAEKKDSQGICFIGKVKLPEFLQQQIKPKKGDVIEIPNNALIYQNKKNDFNTKEEELGYTSKKWKYTTNMGKKVGEHQGAHFYTKGQRKGLGIGGTKEPLFIIENDVKSNIIYVGQGKFHNGLLRKSLFISNEEIHWVRPDLQLQDGQKMEVYTRIRYRQPLQKAVLYQFKKGLYLDFKNKQYAITEGQFSVWYQNDELIGSGVIS